MLNLPQTTLTKIKNTLQRKQSEVEAELKAIDNEDVVMVDSLAEASEPGTESFEADVHTRLVALKNDLSDMLKRTKDSLMRINKGTYGKCEKCGKAIETERLEAMPTATLCIACSKKSTR